MQFLILKFLQSMSGFVMSVSCNSVMKNLEACMQQGVANSPMTIETFYNGDLSTVEECIMAKVKKCLYCFY